MCGEVDAWAFESRFHPRWLANQAGANGVVERGRSLGRGISVIEPPIVHQQPLLRVLDSVEGILTRLFRLFLGLIIAAVVAVMGFVYISKPFGPGNQGEYVYFTIGSLLVLSWAGGQFIALDRRLKRRSMLANLPTNSSNGVTTWNFRFGGSPVESATSSPMTHGLNPFTTSPQTAPDPTQFSPSPPATRDVMQFSATQECQIPFATLPGNVIPNDETLRRLEMELARGTPIDLACELVQPAFRSWSSMQRWAYTHLVESLLKQRQSTPGAAR